MQTYPSYLSKNPMMNFQERLTQAPALVLDGATGTEIDRRGVPTTLPLWSAGALLTHPEVVRAIHQDYLEAGADILTTNTFRTHARNVGDAAQARELTALAVKLAQEAREKSGRTAYVAGSVAPLEDCYSPQLVPPTEQCELEQRQMVETLAKAGVNLCLIETMNTIREAVAAARAAQDFGVPFVVSFVLNDADDLLSGETLAEAVQAVSVFQPAALLVNCIPTRHIGGALAKLKALTPLSIGAYGNMGTPEDVVGWAAAGDVPPHTYCEFASEWLTLGAKIVGSCCGSNPEHTAALRRRVDGAAC
jgi:homocysteine S-methyltransferase